MPVDRIWRARDGGRHLGAARAVGVDDDADAIQSAMENLELNHVPNVKLRVGDVMTLPLRPADVVTANLTGALIGASDRLLTVVRPGGVLIMSGIHAAERDEVRRVFAGFGRRRRQTSRLVLYREALKSEDATVFIAL